MSAHDPVNHPKHYTSDASGVECIEVARTLPFSLGNAVKYLWRAGMKGDAVEDIRKALWYLRDHEENSDASNHFSDPALARLPWKDIATWALHQDPFDNRVLALMAVLKGDYPLARNHISSLLDQPTNANDYK